MRKHTHGIPALAVSVWLFCGAAGRAQDFQHTFALAPDGQIRVGTISGEVRIQGYDGTTVVVEGFKVGRDRDRVEIVDMSRDNRIDLSVRYPERYSGNASVNFQVRVPRSIGYNFESISSVSGSVRLADITGQVRAVSVSGAVEVRNVSGMVSASSTSGNVDVYLARISGSGNMNMKFSSVSGNVSVRAPANLNANVDMSTLSGSLTTDFPIEVHERRYAPGRWARGRVGEGACSIRITSVSGRVSLTKG